MAGSQTGSQRHRMFGTALVDAVGPALLIGWSEIGPWMLRQIFAVCLPATPAQPVTAPPAVELPGDLLGRARELDTERRVATGRPISRDTLRERMRIGRDRASALVAAVRAEAAAAHMGTARLRAA